FRYAPARAQAYVADFLQKDGWFDESRPLDFPGVELSRPDERVGEGRSGEAWGKAHQMYKEYGERNGLYYEPLEFKNLEELTQRYREANPDFNPMTSPDLYPTTHSPEEKLPQDALVRLLRYDTYRGMTNCPHWYFRTQVEAPPEAVTARRFFYEADLLRKKAVTREKAIKLYEDPRALPAWKKILLDHRDF